MNSLVQWHWTWSPGAASTCLEMTDLERQFLKGSVPFLKGSVNFLFIKAAMHQWLPAPECLDLIFKWGVECSKLDLTFCINHYLSISEGKHISPRNNLFSVHTMALSFSISRVLAEVSPGLRYTNKSGWSCSHSKARFLKWGRELLFCA